MSNGSANPSATSPLWVKLLGVAVLLPFGIGLISLQLPPWAEEMARDWGPAFVLMLIFGAGFYRYVPHTAMGDFLSAQKEQAVAMTAIAISLRDISGQGGKLDEINSRLEDTLINQRVMMRQLEMIQKPGEHVSLD